MSAAPVRRAHQLGLRIRRFAAAVAVVAIATLGSAAPTAATTAVHQSQQVTFHGSAGIPTSSRLTAICDACAPDTQFGGAPVGLAARAYISANVSWTAPSQLDLAYDPSQLAPGSAATVTGRFSQSAATPVLTVQYFAQGDYGVAYTAAFPDASNSYYGVYHAVFSTSETVTEQCSLTFAPGSLCYLANTKLTIASGTVFGIANTDISVWARLVVGVAADGVATIRSLNVSDSPIVGPDTIANDAGEPSTLTDAFTLPCSAPVGSEAYYDLSSTQNLPPAMSVTTSTQGTYLAGSIYIRNQLSGQYDMGATVTTPMTPLDLAAQAEAIDLGPILANTQPPVANAGGPYSGYEGSEIQFDASNSSSPCGSMSGYSWSFSDGGTAYGPTPTHAFQASGDYTGRLTVTGPGGSSSQDFDVSVGNLPPVVSAGVDTAVAWGRPLAFTGTATDPGVGDQSTLTYSWDFGDTSAVETGNGLAHSYSTPGVYTATFTACDRWDACASDSRQITVRKRAVTASYVGGSSGTYGLAASLRTSMVDEFGSPVVGRSVAFSIGIGTTSEVEGSATTDSTGTAGVLPVVGLDAGAYLVSTTFVGDTHYEPAGTTTGFTVARNSTSIAYTGALSGGMNKTVTLSAILRDASGAAMGARTVTFQLGSQTVTAATDSYGLAATSLKLTQKGGTYTVTATFMPTGTDSSRYAGSLASATFKLNAK